MKIYDLLLVDDDPLILKTLGESLETQGYYVTMLDSGKKAVKAINEKNFDLIITDLVMDSVDGISVLKHAKDKNPDTAVIVLTGYGDITSAVDALRLNADDYLLKPCEADEIHFRVWNCIQKVEYKKRLKLYEGILPVCCVCKKIRDDFLLPPGKGDWFTMEDYLVKRAKVQITSSYCPVCAQKVKEEIDKLRL
jgi:DNA-binding response OmpR family regulator